MVAALALGLTFVSVDVVGEGSCPPPADVSRRLADLLPAAGSPPAAPHLARLSRADRGVHVELLSATGEPLAARDLGGGDESCDDLAGAIAVVNQSGSSIRQTPSSRTKNTSCSGP